MTAPVSSRETGIRLAVRSTLDICAFVDRLELGAVGELVVRTEDAVCGAVFIERGRICWAYARGLAARLTQLLMAPSGVDAATMEGLYRRCKAERVPLGELLVDYGIVTPEQLHAALLEHTAESLAALPSRCAEGVLCLRASGGYSPRFTFSTSELLARTLAVADERAATNASAVLESCFALDREDEWGAAFVRAGNAVPLPVAVRGSPPSTATALLRVGRWAASAIDVATAFQGAPPFVTTLEGSGVLVAWMEGETIIAGRMGASGPARILNRRAAARRAEEESRG